MVIVTKVCCWLRRKGVSELSFGVAEATDKKDHQYCHVPWIESNFDASHSSMIHTGVMGSMQFVDYAKCESIGGCPNAEPTPHPDGNVVMCVVYKE